MNRNKWKILFFLLLGVNICIIITLNIMLHLPAEDEKYKGTTLNVDDYIPFQIQTNKQNLNQVINHYLDKEGLTGTIDYQVFLTDEVDLYGSIPFFSQNIEMKLSFEPQTLENGDIVLQQKSISLGLLELPVPNVLQFINDQYELPDWVTIQPNEETIYVALTEMDLDSGYKVKVNQFDMKNDQIQFSLYVPLK